MIPVPTKGAFIYRLLFKNFLALRLTHLFLMVAGSTGTDLIGKKKGSWFL
jgi:hypothetical protein